MACTAFAPSGVQRDADVEKKLSLVVGNLGVLFSAIRAREVVRQPTAYQMEKNVMRLDNFVSAVLKQLAPFVEPKTEVFFSVALFEDYQHEIHVSTNDFVTGEGDYPRIEFKVLSPQSSSSGNGSLDS